MSFSIELPLNQTGLGNVGIGIAVELYNRGLTPNIFLIGAPDFSYANLPKGFPDWFNYCTSKALGSFKRSEHSIRLWHIQGSQSRLTDDATLYTVHETGTLTKEEVNIMSQYSRICVPSNYSKTVFEAHGLQAAVCPNFFDRSLFFQTEVPREGLEDVTIFSVLGKLERRKWTTKTIAAWCKRFGGEKAFRLHCHVFNPHLMNGVDPKDYLAAHKHIIQKEIGHVLPWNVTVYGFQTKEEYNLSLNVADIDVSLSGGEGFGLPLLTTRVLGKRGVALKGHSYVDFCSEENTVWVEPSGKVDSADGIFFQKGTVFNQGQIFDWEESAAIEGMEKALEMKAPDPEVGKRLAEKFSAANTVNQLLEF